MKRVLKVLFSRLIIMGLLMAVQIAIIILLSTKLTRAYVYLYTIFQLLSLIVVFFINSQRSNPSHKLAWTIPILIFPVFGSVLYILLRSSGSDKIFRRRVNDLYQKSVSLLDKNEHILSELNEEDKNIANQSRYMSMASSFPPYKNTTTRYFPSGEDFFLSFIEELKKAQHFIFIESFIIQNGLMWGTILKILEEKAKEGLDIRVMYDDAGCLTTLPYKYYRKLREKGIQCQVFNPFTPLLGIRMNNRDHRKIFVIDGYIAYTGGINLADEYINAREKYGYWKDAAILIKGEAVWNMTIMFLQLWDYIARSEADYNKYRPQNYQPGPMDSDGYVQPYGDSPIDNEPVGKNVYLNIMGRARDYVYIFTPYLILDYQTVTELMMAAKSGVDVRIVTPHIPDKWYVFLVTQSYYPILIEAGVRIYEYSPGFLHSKVFVCDDVLGTVGSINLDYRSLYFQFECGVWLYKAQCIKEIKQDFLDTFEQCHEITLEECRKISVLKRIVRGFFRLFAPLM